MLAGLSVFDILEKNTIDFSLVKFEVIGPDSFMWRLNIGEHIYYLYVTDYSGGLADIQQTFRDYLESDEFELVPVRVEHTTTFEDSIPVKNAVVYQKADDSDDMMQFASSSGFDSVFLAKSSEDADASLFASYAPRGFSR